MSTDPADDVPPSLSFGAVAGAYERSRPTYPQEIVDWLVPEGARRVVDLGAGTGKFTRRLLGRGLEVVAVEPSPGMRETFAQAVPDVSVIAGSAEQIPLEDASVDAVFAAQAWHWVEPATAVLEVARVLRPSGVLGLVWNSRDESVPWVAALSELVTQYGATNESNVRPVVGDPFGKLTHHEVSWSDPMTANGVVELLASRSYVATLSSSERAVVLGGVRGLLSEHPDTAGREIIDMPYVTRAFKSQRTDQPVSPR